MRTLFLSLAMVVIVCSFRARSQTTLEEYNYVTKGYKVQLESGLDMKKGYRFEDVPSFSLKYSNGQLRDMDFKALYRDSVRLPVALLCIYNHPDSGPKEYICIPQFNSSKEIWDSTLTKISAISPENTTGLLWGLAKLASYYSMK